MKDLRDRIYLGIGGGLLVAVSLWMAFIGYEYLLRILDAISKAGV